MCSQFTYKYVRFKCIFLGGWGWLAFVCIHFGVCIVCRRNLIETTATTTNCNSPKTMLQILHNVAKYTRDQKKAIVQIEKRQYCCNMHYVMCIPSHVCICSAHLSLFGFVRVYADDAGCGSLILKFQRHSNSSRFTFET